MKQHLNHIILYDGEFYRIFERMGIPFEAYNPQNHLGIGRSIEECLADTTVNLWDIETHPIEVVFNE